MRGRGCNAYLIEYLPLIDRSLHSSSRGLISGESTKQTSTFTYYKRIHTVVHTAF